tara:strand:+ start:79 stop:378 length:300 start_codon:yes stop_codon:yes gene_type:complete
MVFIEKINKKKFELICFILFIYIALNLLEGDRGLFSYFKNIKVKNELLIKKKILSSSLESIEKKNYLLTEIIDLDYLEILYRKKFMLGKENEKIFTIKN